MNEKELLALWEKLKASVEDMGNYTYEKFKERLSTPDGRSNFHKLYSDHLQLGDLKSWESSLMNINIKSSNKTVTKYPSQPKQTKTFQSRQCDENIYPWTIGCKNNKIGQMNDIYFGDRYGDIYGKELYNHLDSLGYFFLPNQKDGEITEYLYNLTLKNSEDKLNKENKIIRKKVIKETVKKIFKERLNKK